MRPLILIANDEETFNPLEEILSKQYLLLKAADEKIALDILNKEPVQFLICDINISAIRRLEFCKTIKSSTRYSHVPLLVISSENSIEAKVKLLENGADAYIEKPFDNRLLLAQIASLITNRNRIKEYFSTSPLAHVNNINYTKVNERFFENLNEIIAKSIEDSELDVNKLARIMNMSRITLYRKIKAVSDLTPNELINLVRLKKAASMLREGEYKIYQVADMTGFSSQSNFSRNFLRQFEMTPSEYINLKQNGQLHNYNKVI